MVKAPKRFIQETLWPAFEQINATLHTYLDEMTDRIIAEVIHGDSSDAAEMAPSTLVAGPLDADK